MKTLETSRVACRVVSLVVLGTVFLILTLLHHPVMAQEARCENNRIRIFELAKATPSSDRNNQIANDCARMKELKCPEIPPFCATGIVDPICWKWTWTLKNENTGETTVTMNPDGTIKGSDYGLSGSWKLKTGDWNTDGAEIEVDWRRGEDKKDKLTLSEKGQTLTGSNFETSEKGIVATKKPCSLSSKTEKMF